MHPPSLSAGGALWLGDSRLFPVSADFIPVQRRILSRSESQPGLQNA
jgi:hypothetical protein